MALFSRYTLSEDANELMLITRSFKNDTLIALDGENLVIKGKDGGNEYVYGATLKGLADLAVKQKDFDEKEEKELKKLREEIEKPLLETIKNLTQTCSTQQAQLEALFAENTT